MYNRYIIPSGTRVGIYIFGIFLHVGIVSDGWLNGEQTVFSRSKRAGFAKEELISVFTSGYDFHVLPPLSDLHPTLIIANARRLLGTPWRLADANCEHFVHECFGLKPKSPQVYCWSGVAALALLVMLTSSG